MTRAGNLPIVIVVGVLAAFWTAVVVGVFAVFAYTAWTDESSASGGGAATPTAGSVLVTATPDRPRPDVLPPEAGLLEADLTLGEPYPPVGGPRDGGQVFFALRCGGDVAVLSTTQAVFYAEFPCDRMPPDRLFVDRHVQVRFRGGDPATLTVESAGVEALTLDVGRVWLRSR